MYTNMNFSRMYPITLLLASLSMTAQCVQFDHGSLSSVPVLAPEDNRIRGVEDRIDKDFVLGGLIGVHNAETGSSAGRCGEIRLERSVERVEAMLFAIDLINSNSSLLPGLEIGYDIRDTCGSVNIGLDETFDFVLTSRKIDIDDCQSAISSGNGSIFDNTTGTPTTGIVGAASSEISVPVANLGRLFQMPQISYASSSAFLSNRDRYTFFYRTIPPDNFQARAMIDLLLKFDWTYVSIIYLRNAYGGPWATEFRQLALEHAICIDLDEGVDDFFVAEDFALLANQLLASEADVVIIFTGENTPQKLLSIISETSDAQRFTWIASDGWARSINTVHQFNQTAAGLYGIAPLAEHVALFHDYFSLLTLDSNKRNPWFPEFFSAFLNCSLANGASNPCPRNKSITQLSQYEQGNIVPLIIDAVYAFAHALNNFLNDSCAQPIDWNETTQSCAGQVRAFTGPVLLEYISRLDFMNEITGNHIKFDDMGNVEGRYEIVNYQAVDEGGKRRYAFVNVAFWDSSVPESEALLFFENEKLQFGLKNDTVLNVPRESQCKQCGVGFFSRFVSSACCAVCEPCLGNLFSNLSSPNCFNCTVGHWGNNPLTGSSSCVPIPKSFIRHSDPFSVVVMVLAIIGLIAVIFTTIVYFVFWKTPIVKSSGREQMITLLIGIGLMYILAFVYVSPPEPGVCTIQRIGFWVCYSIIFGALLVKIVRVTRIFYRSANLSRIRFTEPYYQVLFTCIIIIGQFIVLIIGLLVVKPEVTSMIRLNRDNSNDIPELVVSCVTDHTAILAICGIYETALIVASTILGVLSFKYPKNFNEAKFVSFCTFIIVIIWAAFIGLYIYFIVERRQEIRNAITGLASVLVAYAVLGCLFGPKLYVIFFRSAKNKKSSSDFESDANLTTINLTVNNKRNSIFGNTLPTASSHSINTMAQTEVYVPPKIPPPSPVKAASENVNGEE